MMNLSDLDHKYVKKMIVALIIAFIPSEILSHILSYFFSGAYVDLFISLIVPGSLIVALFYVGFKYNKEKEEMLGL